MTVVATAGPIADAIAAGELPGRVWLYSNYHCNLACSYCLTESSPRSERRQLTPELMLGVAGEAAALGFTGLGVTGGEPMLLAWLPDTIASMAEHLPVVVLTNGTLFVGDRIKRARPLARDGVAVQISLDSHLSDVNDMARGPDNFAKVVEAVPQLIALGVRVRIATTTAGPLDDPALEPLKELVLSLGVAPEDHLVRPIVRRGRADERGLGVAAVARDIPSELTITADGAYWGSFGPTVRAGRLDTDLLITRTVLPLSVPANALLSAVRGLPPGNDANLGIR
ncbi:MAG: radical SAM protein [Acidimicrobiia bacterium]|nr:radical SAM protein [Acidimicrobiia bacterium]MBA3983243.1 radical SAM protein [Acidimicrobiia bacterium]MDQ3392379.1 radical SAM protein [Actinomycetota bacterium]